ncbi:MAG: hypothetical protein AAF436_17630 [Myxococcota bacterium]
MPGQGTTRAFAAVALFIAGAIAAYVFIRDEPEPASGMTERTSAQSPSRRARPSRPSPGSDFDGESIPDSVDATLHAPHFDLAQLDYDGLRLQTPDNLYWLLAAPTDDAAALKAREAEKARRNTQYGRVVSGVASQEEIEDYYTYRRKLSEDYVEVAQLILDAHGDELSERDVGLFELTIGLHASRLAELPQKLDDALRRKAEYDEVKRAWRNQQAAELDTREADAKSSPK